MILNVPIGVPKEILLCFPTTMTTTEAKEILWDMDKSLRRDRFCILKVDYGARIKHQGRYFKNKLRNKMKLTIQKYSLFVDDPFADVRVQREFLDFFAGKLTI